MNPTIVCDRCKQEKEGFSTPEFTAGYYNTTEGGYWAKFANPGETKVCDDCMFVDPRYIAVYGRYSNVTEEYKKLIDEETSLWDNTLMDGLDDDPIEL